MCIFTFRNFGKKYRRKIEIKFGCVGKNYEVLKDANGKEVGRTNYYYSPYKAITTGITSVASSSDKAQAIYSFNGQKVATTQTEQIYIQNGKKFIAK